MAGTFDDVSGVDAARLEPLVQRLLDAPGAILGDWTWAPLGGGGGEGGRLFQLAGSANVMGASRPWALVLKVAPAAAAGAAPDAWDNPTREALAYGSGLLGAFPGRLRAPRCLAVEMGTDGSSWLWLERVVDAHPGPWGLDRYVEAAHQLGRFNGAYLAGDVPLPDHPWLSRGWLRGFVAAAGPTVVALEQRDTVLTSEVLQRLYPPSVVAGLRRLWTEREVFLGALDRLPHTLCHHDAFRRNWLVQAGPLGDGLVAIDWAYTGHGAVGEDLVPLVAGSLLFFEAPAITPRALDAACYAAYVAGLAEAGWAGDEQQVRLGYTAAAALRYTVGTLRLLVPDLADPTLHPALEAFFGCSLGEMVDAWTDLWAFEVDLAEEARALVVARRKP